MKQYVLEFAEDRMNDFQKIVSALNPMTYTQIITTHSIDDDTAEFISVTVQIEKLNKILDDYKNDRISEYMAIEAILNV